MTFDIKPIDIAGNSSIGLFAFATDKYVILPFSTKKKVKETCKEILKVNPIEVTLVNSKLIGLFATGTEDILLVPDVITFEELDYLRQNLPETEIEVIHSKITALGNTITIGEKIAFIHPDFEVDARKKLEDVLDREIIPRKVMNSPLVGSILFQNKNGILAHPMISDLELEEVQEIFGKKGDITTVNRGTPYPRPGIIANSHGALVGSDSTGPEIMRIFNILGP
ncbi:MAG: translation initiation factor IF-6 [Methanobacteriota archaeon]|nr:MAG: translation initiation factor IF-6 [Euryarchaeota archaeon]